MGQSKDDIIKLQSDFLEILPRNACDISKTCKACNITRTTYYRWLKDYPEFESAVKECKENDKDWVESQMKTLMRGIPILDEKNIIVGWKVKPSETMLIFYAKTQMKDRGYGDTVDSNTNNIPIQIINNYV